MAPGGGGIAPGGGGIAPGGGGIAPGGGGMAPGGGGMAPGGTVGGPGGGGVPGMVGSLGGVSLTEPPGGSMSGGPVIVDGVDGTTLDLGAFRRRRSVASARGSVRSGGADPRSGRAAVPFDEFDQLGPLRPLAGTWEGVGGLDVSFHHAEGEVGETQYRERITFAPFGPVDNGDQHLYGLDYRMSAWRDGEEDPFHTEIGYWLWDAAAGKVLRAFMVPRGTVVLASAEAGADSTEFTFRARLGDPVDGIVENEYLSRRASTVSYECTVRIDGDEFSYDEDSVLRMTEIDELFHHTDRNVLRRVHE